MEKAIHLLGRKNVRVVAIIVRDVSLAGMDLLKHKLLPKDRNPILQWHPQDAGWKNVSEGIQQGIDDFNWKWALSSFLQEERVRQQSAGLLNKRYGRSIKHCSISRIDIKPSFYRQNCISRLSGLRVHNRNIIGMDEVTDEQRKYYRAVTSPLG